MFRSAANIYICVYSMANPDAGFGVSQSQVYDVWMDMILEKEAILSDHENLRKN